MDDTTREALKESISKWDALTKVQSVMDANIGPKACPLCKLFKHNTKGECHGCPVKEMTGLSGCLGTPYTAAQIAKIDWLRNIDQDMRDHLRVRFHIAAEAERDFLKALLSAKAVAS